MTRFFLFVLALLTVPAASGQRATGLSNWSIVLDPGHSQNENVGFAGYSEARKVLAIGLELRALLLGLTDIGAVYMTRTSENVVVSLQERVDYANSTGAAYFHSIHSNAGPPEANNLFVLWPQDPATMGEPPAAGGRLVAQTMGPILGRAMRVPLSNNGAWGECSFYGVTSCSQVSPDNPKGSRNFVQRKTVMPSTLSEAGFHTNPTQNQRNMSADWKRMEARAMFYSFLKTRGVARPAARIVMGIAADAESGLPINGAVVTMGGKADTTDTYERVFRFYSNDPNELRNGFFYLEDVPSGPGTLAATAPNYRSASASVTPVDTFFTIQDLSLVSTAPLVVAERTPAPNATGFRVVDPITLVFNRPVDTASVRTAFAVTRVGGGAVAGTRTWSSGNRRLTFYPAQTLQAFTQYEVTLAGTTTSPYGFMLDGNGDGVPGDGIAYRFATGAADVAAPVVQSLYPANNGRNVELLPLINVTFDEEVVASSYQPSAITLSRTFDNAAVPVTVRASLVGSQTVLYVVPGAPLSPSTFYRLTLPAGMADRFGNAVPTIRNITFQTNTFDEDRTPFETFEGDFAANWWAPTQSGSTTQASIVADSTGMEAVSIANPLRGSTKAMQLRFGFKTDASNWLIREYLNSGPAYAARFDTSHTLQAYVHGDGSGVLFRFAVDDGCAGSSCAGTEVSPWTAVTWRGWRKVEWDLGSTPPGAWLSGQNGQLDGQLRFDSFQLSYAPGSPAFGRIVIDDLAFVRTRLATGTADAPPAGEIALDGVAPNPVGPQGVVRFRLDEATPVTLDVFDALGRRVARLADGETLPAGSHVRTWNTDGLAPGLYVLRLTAGSATRTASAVVR